MTASGKASKSAAPVLLYDGVCGFCNQSVQFIIKRDRDGNMRFAALQSEYGQSLIARHPELAGVDSLVFVDRSGEDERVYVRSAAALRVAGYLGGWWRAFLIFRVVPAPLRDFFYDLFARYRYRLFGKSESCMLPPPETRARFLDIE